MSKRQLPDVIKGTTRAWRAKKRWQMRAVKNALDAFQIGCAYTPLYPDRINELNELVHRCMEELRGDWKP